VPVQVIIRKTETTAALYCHLVLGSPAGHDGRGTGDLTMSLQLPEDVRVSTTRPDGYFEDALADIQRQLAPDMFLKASCLRSGTLRQNSSVKRTCALSTSDEHATPATGEASPIPRTIARKT
jgi:hypothetical protein